MPLWQVCLVFWVFLGFLNFFFRYPLSPKYEDFAILLNGSLIVKSQSITGILPPGDFCMETVDIESDGLKMLVFVCAPAVKINQAMSYTYISRKIFFSSSRKTAYL